MTCSNRSAGVTALSVFFAFGAAMALLAATMLLFPGSILEPIWRLNPQAREALSHMGWWAVLLMAVVGAACATAALGLLRCKRWGYSMALAILSVNLLGDAANALIAHDWRTLIGLPIGGAMIFYLLKKRRVFGA
jgi:hypothetical protein